VVLGNKIGVEVVMAKR